MMKRMMIRLPKKKMKVTNKKVTVIATAVTALLSATAAFAAIKVIKKSDTADKSEFETVLDGLVEAGTITQAQEIAIQNAITTAKEAHIANGDFASGDDDEFETVLDSSQTGTLTRLKKSFKVRSQQLKKRVKQMAM